MRTNHVSAARKPQGSCQSCGEPIHQGQPYKWIKSRYGPKQVRHGACPGWRPSEMTNAKYATALAAQESANDALDALDASSYDDPADFVSAIEDILNDCASDGEECRDDYQDGIDSMPDALQDSAYEAQEKVDNLESWVDTLQGWSPSQDEPDEVDDPELDADEVTDAVREAFADWAQTVLDEAREAVEDLSI